jgi:hypothetical protein
MNPRPSPGFGPLGQSRALRALIGICAVALVTMAATAAQGRDDRDDDDDDPEFRGPGICSATAQLQFKACGFEARDDFYVAKAKCINIADARERASCHHEARQARTEVGSFCREQLEWRRAACRVLGEQRYAPPFTPELFDSDFRRLSNPNPYFPLGIGNRWEYRGGGELNIVEVADETKLVEGVSCLVLRDLVYQDGRLVESTDDWYAAARDGSTWYCGEEVKDYATFAGDRPERPELVSIDGSFKHGRDRNKAGTIMPARPRQGRAYLEEFALGAAEDVSEVVSASYSWGANPTLDRLVPHELALRLCNRDCVVTKNYSLLEPGTFALKYYAREIGFFLETKPDQSKAVQLVGCNFDSRCVVLPAP